MLEQKNVNENKIRIFQFIFFKGYLKSSCFLLVNKIEISVEECNFMSAQIRDYSREDLKLEKFLKRAGIILRGFVETLFPLKRPIVPNCSYNCTIALNIYYYI